MLMQTMSLVDRKDASVKDIDVAMKLGCGHPSKFILFCELCFYGMVDDPIFLSFNFLFFKYIVGPLHLADYIGLDTCYFIVSGWMEKYPDESDFFIPACLQANIEAGNLGRKTGKGFYHWEGEKRGNPVE
jgi:3-hydroxyacyl-CoA dehydrogenase